MPKLQSKASNPESDGEDSLDVHPKRRRWRRRLLQIFGIVICSFVFLLVGTYFYVTRSGFLTNLAAPILSSMSGGEATIGSASFTQFKRLTLRDVRIRVPGLEGEAGELAFMPEVWMEIDWKGLWAGQLATERIVVAPGARLRASEDAETGLFNFGDLALAGFDPFADSFFAATDIIIPEILILRATIEMGEHRGATYRKSGSIDIAGALVPESQIRPLSDPEAHWYRVRLRELDEIQEGRRATGPRAAGEVEAPATVRIEGRLNPHTGQASAIIQGLSFDRDRAPLMPRRIREWWKTLQPSGTFGTLAVTVRSSGEYTLEIPMDGIDWNLPISVSETLVESKGKSFYAAESSGLRMTDVRGSLLVHESGAEFVALSGIVDGVRYNLRGEFTSLSRLPGFDLTFEIHDFDLAQNLEILTVLPPNIRATVDEQLLQLERQSGTINATVRLQRAESAGHLSASAEGSHSQQQPKLQIEGVVQIHGAAGTYRSFPYRVTGLTAEIEFDNDEIRILSLAGRTETGGGIWLAGTISELGMYPKIDLEMYATRIPLDDRLKNALGDRTAALINKFMHASSAAALRNAGLIMTPDDRIETQQRILDLKRSVLHLQEEVEGTRDPQSDVIRDDSKIIAEIQREIHQIEAQLERIPDFVLGGRVNLSSTLKRAPGPDQPLRTTTRLKLAHRAEPIGVIYQKLPYPLYFVGGEIEIAWGQVTILEELRFVGLTGADVRVTGMVDRVREPTYHIEEDLQIRADLVPVDTFLVHALPGKFKDAAARAGWPGERLSAAGRIVAGLNLTGDLTVAGTITHDPVRRKADYEFEIEISNGRTAPFDFVVSEDSSEVESRAGGLNGAAAGVEEDPASFADGALNWSWPAELPIDDLSGALTVRRTGLEIHHLKGVLETAGQIELFGDLDWSGARTEIHLNFDAQNLRVSDPLIELIGGIAGPATARQVNEFCEDYALQGVFDAKLAWERTSADGQSLQTIIEPQIAELTIGGSPIHFADVAGRLIFDGDLIQFEKLSANLHSPQHPQTALGALKIDGTISRSENSKTKLVADIQNARFEALFIPGILRALGQSATAGDYTALDPRGLFRAELILGQPEASRDSKEESDSLGALIVVHPESAEFSYRNQRYEVSRFAGAIAFDATQVIFRGLSGEFQDGTFALDGTIDYGDGLDVQLDLGLQVKDLSARARALLPTVVQQTINALELESESVLQMNDAKLRYRDPSFGLAHNSAGAPDVRGVIHPTFDFTGTLQLHNARLAVPVAINQLMGEVAIDVSRAAGDDWPQVDLKMKLASLRAEGRLIEEVQLELMSGDRPGLLLIPGVIGRCYEGLITAEAIIQLARPGEPGYYEAVVRLADVNAAPFMADSKSLLSSVLADGPAASTDEISKEIESPATADGDKPGSITAYLAVGGIIGEPNSRRGRGAVQIIDGQLYEVPINMWALQLSSLTLPVATSFEDADLRFHIDGDKIVFEQIELESPLMKMNGTGQIGISSGQLDLRFKTASRFRAPLFSDLWERLRDGLFSIRVTGTLDHPVTELVTFQ